ncbi:hypothetical protein QBC39DRAFT_369783 [Podospora conica]|nr:hypothetical protein QBC39DRAFT_369783 [Schizothecium conicum]
MSSEYEKTSAAQVEAAKPKKRGHCAKFWWAYLIAIVVIAVIVVPVILLVAVPKIAQSKLDDAELTLDSVVISNSYSNNLTMTISSTIRSDGKVHAKIDPFVGVMYLEDLEPHTPFAALNFPPTTSDKLQVVNVTQVLEITDLKALTTFNTWLLSNETLRITIRGDTHIRVKGISRAYPVTFKKTLTTNGLRGFDGTTVTDTSVTLEPDARGNNFKGTAMIPNHSIFTLDIGNATFYNYLLGKEVGTVYIDNILLNPGENKFPMRATVDNGAVLAALASKPYCDAKKGVLPLVLRGKTVQNAGESLPYFADALGSHNQTVDVDIGTPVAKLLGGNPVPCSAEGGAAHST